MQRRYVNQPNYERGDKRRGVGGEAFHLGTIALTLWHCPRNNNPPLTPNACKRFLFLIWTKCVPRLACAVSCSAPLAARRSSSIPLFCRLLEKKWATCAAKHVVKTLCSHFNRTVTAQAYLSDSLHANFNVCGAHRAPLQNN